MHLNAGTVNPKSSPNHISTHLQKGKPGSPIKATPANRDGMDWVYSPAPYPRFVAAMMQLSPTRRLKSENTFTSDTINDTQRQKNNDTDRRLRAVRRHFEELQVIVGC
jgi:hypothetical protein